MVYPDLNSFDYSEKKFKPAVPIRILSVVIDYFIFAPVISFVMLVLFHGGVDIYRSFPRSDEAQNVLGYLVFGFLFFATFFQALFIAFMQATPGQYFLKLRIEFKNNQYPVFLQAWARQLGFCFSFIFLGIPFLKALADENGQCFYEKMTESTVVSRWPVERDSYFFKTLDVDRKFWSASLATLSTFIILLVAVAFWKNYQHELTSPESYTKFKNKKKTCTEFVHLDSTERLRFAIAMNLVGTVSDACLDQEADFVLWRNFTDDRALAYFAKFVTSTQDRLESKYLKQACEEGIESEGCYWSKIFTTSNFAGIQNNAEMAQTILGKVLAYEMVDSQKGLLKDFKEYSDYKSVKKFLLLESLEGLQPMPGRLPASVKSDTQLSSEELKELIEDL